MIDKMESSLYVIYDTEIKSINFSSCRVNSLDHLIQVECTEIDKANYFAGTHYFDETLKKVVSKPKSVLDQIKQKQDTVRKNKTLLKFLADTDWKILRHIREKALNLPTSLSDSEYIALEKSRHDAATEITKD
jgi:hypothetical protein